MDRRVFIKKTGIITAGSLLIPSFLKANLFSKDLKLKNKRLVIVQLSGGNDGLNTVIPYGLDEYYQNRKQIGILENKISKIDERFGFNSKLSNFHDLHQRGLLSIVNSVGYPNPNRSHFRSMDIWHTASDSDENLQTGWLGRYLDNNCTNSYEGIDVGGSLSLAMKGDLQAGIALTDPKSFHETMSSEFFKQLNDPISENDELNFLYKVFNDTKNSAEYIYDQYKLKTNSSQYKGRFGQKLKQIATLIKSDIQTPVFYTELSGFDTHVNQTQSQDRLFDQLNEGIGSFVADLEKDDLMKETTIMVFSEFGRRLKENASRGTDHGAANVLFIIDTDFSAQAHKYNEINLQELRNGDPIFKVDFRSVYQDLLSNRLNVDPKNILRKTFKDLNMFNV